MDKFVLGIDKFVLIVSTNAVGGKRRSVSYGGHLGVERGIMGRTRDFDYDRAWVINYDVSPGKLEA